MDGEDGEDGWGGGEGEGVDHEDGDGGVGGFYTRRVCSVDSVLRYSHAQLQAKNMKQQNTNQSEKQQKFFLNRG